MSIPTRRVPPGRLVFMSLAVALLSLELGLRLVDWRAGRDAEFFAPPADSQRLYAPHPYIGYVLNPSLVLGETGRRGKYTIRINSLGFRGPERSVEKPAGSYRIFCLGGSTTFGTAATKNETTYPAQLESMLNPARADGLDYEVWNCGVSGYTSAESLINLQLRLLQYAPDAILVYHAANDARPIQARGFRPDYAHMRRAWTTNELSGFERFLLRNVRTYAWIARGTDPEQQFGALASRVFVPGFKDLHVPAARGVPEEGVEAFLSNMRSIIAVARANDITPVLATFAICPEMHQPEGEDFLGTIESINAGLKALALEEDVALIDLEEGLNGRAELFDDWMHLNDKGSRRHARLVVGAAHELGLFGLR